MIKITIKDTRSCSIKTYGERVRKGDNRIASLLIEMPECFGEYNRGSCSVAMKCHVTEGVITYNLRTDSSTALVPITTDITDRKQVVRIDFVITHSGNVIGTTNTVKLEVLDAPDNGEPLTPREQFDAVIREQRATIEEQSATITEQVETISSQGEQITELSGEVQELTTENIRLENLTETQRQTIQNMIDNPPQPQLYTPPVVTPSGSVQQISPPAGYDGLTNTVVDRVTAEVDSDIQPENIKEGVDILGVEGTYNPFPYNSVGGVYITEVNEDGYPTKYLFKNIKFVDNPFIYKYERNIYIKEVVFENCTGITSFVDTSGQGWQFNALRGLKTVLLPENLTTLKAYMFGYCEMLKTINLPSSLTGIGPQVFYNCSSLQFVTIENGFNCNGLSLSDSTRYSAETIVSCLEALADRTGKTAYTITFGTTNLNKLTAEQKAIATNKNWNLA